MIRLIAVKRGTLEERPAATASGRTLYVTSNTAQVFVEFESAWIELTSGGGGGPHAASHQNGGSDEISVAGLSGVLADPQPPTTHTHAQADVTGLVTDLAGKEPANANIQAHVISAHAPSDAQKNSDITKAEIEAKLTGVIASHTHSGGGGGASVEVATVDFGTIPRRSHRLTVTDADVTVASKILVAPGMSDEWEMDPAVLTAIPGTGSFTLCVGFDTPGGVIGARTITYMVS